jgi:PAS domain S-box-containing protein
MNATATIPAPPELDERIHRGLVSLAEKTNNLLALAEPADLRLIHLNPAGHTIIGLEPGTILRELTWMDLIASESLPQFLSEVLPAVERSGCWKGELTLSNRAGPGILVSMIALQVPARDGHPATLAIAATDISKVRGVEESLDNERTLLRALLDHVPDSIYFKDLASRFIRVSAFQARKKGMSSPDELKGKTDFDFFSGEHAQQAYNDEQRIIRTGQPLINIEEKETWPDGRVTWVSTSKMPLHGPDDHIIGTFGISRDITTRKETENRLETTQKELVEASRLAGMAEIASGVLHNIGNALNSVNTSVSIVTEQLNRSRLGNLAKVVQMLEQHAGDLGSFLTQDQRGRQLPTYLAQLAGVLASERENIQREIQQMHRSVEHIKDVVAMQQNYARASYLVEDIDPSTLVDEALYISEMSLNRHGVTVRRDFSSVPRVRVTRHKVLQILVNLIRNAKYAMDETGRTEKEMVISLRTSPEGRIQFMVTDNGVGIPTENMTRIFNFGFTTRKGGHGFGLHSSANAARELNGTLHAHSDGPGKGAVFTFELPPAPATPVRAAAEVQRAPTRINGGDPGLEKASA